ncbi:hypothetical protein P691DRAFT_699151 [Macrolepiota fuliginosa MF-IS2]|uniref:Uncharacterized protein n=1 Tax=Macrolepiota fuliginosa MF-IS2 TaxID=1400762 RepID=A0A9P6C742_9AGAR|nr:hypothetical protein P691DRAFT_699151 [Macrolepiota fuliginosa MF-IS2]
MSQQTLFLLADLLERPPASIEILPGGLKEWVSQDSGVCEDFPFVLVDGHLGIPQKVLYKLYTIAVALYKGADKTLVLILSSIILLANPAHQTALNARKILVREGMLEPKRELDLTSLFIGGSKDCAKQSIIWEHRRWIFRYHYKHAGVAGIGSAECPGWAVSEEASLFPMIPLDVMEKECGLVRQACELYPRNYHAWTHYHWITDAAVAIGASCPQANLYVGFLRGEVVQVRHWIDRHVSDYSAIHLLCNFAVLDRAGAAHLAESGSGVLVDELREHALTLVMSYPSHEALWLYLRASLSFSPSDIARGVIDTLRTQQDIPAHAIEKYILGLL